MVNAVRSIVTDPGVYAPQHDSSALLTALAEASLPRDARVLDLCTGSGVIGIGAALLGAVDVVAFDISAAAVACAQRNAIDNGVRVDVRCGGLHEAVAAGPFDVVLCNPPYVPADPDEPAVAAWDAGLDGRALLDPLCSRSAELLRDGGFALIVHSELSGPGETIRQLRGAGLKASVVSRRTIDFGPVLTERAEWLEQRGMVAPGQRREELVVIRGDRTDPEAA